MPGLTKLQAIALIQQGLGWTAADEKVTEIEAMMQLVQYDELEKGVSLPWWMIVEEGVLVGTANDGTLALPTGFIRIAEDGGLYIITDDGLTRFLSKRPWEWMINFTQDPEDGSTPDGDPNYFALRSTSIEVRPAPTSAWTGYLSYYKHADDISGLGDDEQNVWLINAPSMLVNLTGLRMAEDIEHVEGMQKFQSRFASAQARLTNEIAVREDAGGELSMGNQA